jgi:hypothetical protein
VWCSAQALCSAAAALCAVLAVVFASDMVSFLTGCDEGDSLLAQVRGIFSLRRTSTVQFEAMNPFFLFVNQRSGKHGLLEQLLA